LGDYNMKVMKIALLGTAALVAASISARADALDSLKASMNDMNVSAVADAPAAAPATVVTWGGWVRAGVGTTYNPTAFAASVGTTNYATDIVTMGELNATAKTQTAVGEVGVNVNFRASAANATWGISNGNDAPARTDDFQGWWKMTPNLTLSGGQQGVLKSGYSWDGVATNWMFGQTGGGILGFNSSASDPAELMLAYADGPLGFAVQVYDGNNSANVSSFGVDAKASYKMDAIGFDIGGDYLGSATLAASWAVYGGLGYSAGPFSVGMSLGTGGANSSTVTNTPGSIQAKMALSDMARLELGATRDFTAAGNPTTIGAGLYYAPAKQITLGLEGGYVTGGANSGLYTAGVVTQFSF